MMRIDILSAVPQILQQPCHSSIIGKAIQNDIVDIHIHDLHDYSTDKHKKVDDMAYGGIAGMVLAPQPIVSCIETLQKERNYDAIIYPCPDSKIFTQNDANRLSLFKNIIFICGHYKGIDQRIRDGWVTHEYSIGDYVISGGELPTLVLVDSIVRLLPNAIGNAESALTDSFQDHLLSPPIYTRPAEYRGRKVPKVLTSGNHKHIQTWLHKQALQRTRLRRPDIYHKY